MTFAIVHYILFNVLELFSTQFIDDVLAIPKKLLR